jgi:hypothetical protein
MMTSPPMTAPMTSAPRQPSDSQRQSPVNSGASIAKP